MDQYITPEMAHRNHQMHAHELYGTPDRPVYFLPKPEPKITVDRLIKTLQSKRVALPIRIDRAKTAKEFGLTPIGDDSCFADMVAVHDELPDVVIKVSAKRDAFWDFARAIVAGDLTGDWLPKIYSIVDMGDKNMVVMERIDVTSEVTEDALEAAVEEYNADCRRRGVAEMEPEMNWAVDYDLDTHGKVPGREEPCLSDRYKYGSHSTEGSHCIDWEQFFAWKDEHFPERSTDCHSGNHGWRKNSTQQVLLDPIS